MRFPVLLGCFTRYHLFLFEYLFLPLNLLDGLFNLFLLFSYLSLPLTSSLSPLPFGPLIPLLLVDSLQLLPQPLFLPLLSIPHGLPLSLDLDVPEPPELLDLLPLPEVLPVALLLYLTLSLHPGRLLSLSHEGPRRFLLLLSHLTDAVHTRLSRQTLNEAGFVLAGT